MQWIKFLSIKKTPHYVYKLNQLDYLLIHSSNYDYNKTVVILHGIACVIKTFSNKETIPIAMLSKNDIFVNHNKDYQIYYKIVALEMTYLVTFHKMIKTTTLNTTECYINTLKKYEYMNQVINERKAKKRVLQLILLVCLQFGKIEQNLITIPFKLSREYIAIMTGLSNNTISKIIIKLKQTKIVEKNQKAFNIKQILNINLK